MQHLAVTSLGLKPGHGKQEGDMTQLGMCIDILLPAYQRTTQLGVQPCRHLLDVHAYPRIHEEGAAEGMTHVLHVALEAVRLVGMGQKAQFALVSSVGVRDGTVH